MDAAESSAGAGAAAKKAIPALQANAQRIVLGCMDESIAAWPKLRQCKKLGSRENREGPQVVEFPWTSLYSENATRLSAGFFRVRTGWRRDEWAESPLFICGKLRPENPEKYGDNGIAAAGKAAGTMAVRLDEIRKAAERVAASHGLDVVDLEFTGPARDRILRVTLEKNAEGRAELKARVEALQNEDGPKDLPERLLQGSVAVEQLSGVTHEDCAAFSRDFGVLLDVEDLVPGEAYTLEASSPGLDRKLSRPEEFERFAGCLVKVQTFEPVRNNRHWQGRLVAGEEPSSKTRKITLDLAAMRQNSKSRKTGLNTVEIALSNIEKANLVPEI
jgi:ribosome maturation factor RimP